MPNLYFLICGFFCIVMIVILFFSKKRIDSKETKIYGFMILSSFLDILLVISELLICYFNYNSFTHLIVALLNKIDLIHYIFWPTLLFLYVYYITWGDTNRYEKIKNFSVGIDIFLVLIEFILPIEIINNEGVMGVAGIATDFVFLIATVYLFAIIVILLMNVKKIFKRKYIPLTVLVVLMIIAMLVRISNPTLIIIPTILVFIDLIMYNTIENPDLKMIEELNMAREQAEKANRSKTEFLSNMSHEIRTPLNAIVSFSNSLLKEDLNEKCQEDLNCIVSASSNL